MSGGQYDRFSVYLPLSVCHAYMYILHRVSMYSILNLLSEYESYPKDQAALVQLIKNVIEK